MFSRHPANPIITPKSIQPSQDGYEVIGTFNTGVTVYQDEIILLIRVAERPINPNKDQVLAPHLNTKNELTVTRFQRSDWRFDFSDSRIIQNKQTDELFLTSMSHLRIARSKNGVDFEISPIPWLKPSIEEESFGIEDARITLIGNTYYINYSSISPNGVATGLVSTTDFVNITRHGIIFPPANRDVTFFSEKINGKYVCYHRPMPGMFGGYNIWTASSPDMVHWGEHRAVLTANTEGWESGRVGGGAPPLKTQYGWLSIYHAADKNDRYCLGAYLSSFDDPAHIIGRSLDPIFTPEASYEVNGFFGNVVFTCGAILQDDVVKMYYGAADESIGLAEAPLSVILAALK